MSAQDSVNAYFLSCSAMYSALGFIDVSGLIRCLYSSNSRGLSLVTRASSKDFQNSKAGPPRITSNVKLNLRFLKRAREKKADSRPSTGFRRKKAEKTQSQVNEEVESSIYDSDSYFEEVRPVLLVDGYNICGYWSKLKKHFKRGDLEHARQLLLEELVRFSAIKGIKVVVVFDAVDSGLQDHKETYQGIDVIFSASRAADTWIEKEVELLKEDGCPKIWVATSDLVQQQCANASGAFVWSCRVLLAAMECYLISCIQRAFKHCN